MKLISTENCPFLQHVMPRLIETESHGNEPLSLPTCLLRHFHRHFWHSYYLVSANFVCFEVKPYYSQHHFPTWHYILFVSPLYKTIPTWSAQGSAGFFEILWSNLLTREPLRCSWIEPEGPMDPPAYMKIDPDYRFMLLSPVPLKHWMERKYIFFRFADLTSMSISMCTNYYIMQDIQQWQYYVLYLKTSSPPWCPQDHAEPLRNHLENCLHCQSPHLKSLTPRIFDGTWPTFCKGGFVLVMHLAEFGIWSPNQFKFCCLRTAKSPFVRAW